MKEKISVLFPKKTTQKYYNLHYQYIRDLFEFAGHATIDHDNLNISELSFACIFENQMIAFDFSDNGNEIIKHCEIPTFKFHYREEHKTLRNIFPFTPISFYFKQWFKKEQYHKQIKYDANSEKILNRQRPYGNAVMRRNLVRGILQANYPTACEFSIINQEQYFLEINDTLVHVFVPGQNPRILDRGHLQYLALGCPTISPEIPEILPFNKKLIPNEHYIVIKDDFTDLVDKIEQLKSNRKLAKNIGKNSQKLFTQTCMPDKLISWIKNCIEKFN